MVLVEHAGHLVTKEDLLRTLWPDSFVEEANLSVNVSAVRRAIGDGQTSQAQYIETVPKLGYRFIAPVRQVAPSATQQLPRPVRRKTVAAGALAALVLLVVATWLTSRPTHRVMVAVLPLQNLSGDAGQGYLSEGITEELITDLGKLRPDRIGVIARTSVMPYKTQSKDIKQIGRELGVEYVVEGSVRRDAGQLRVTAQLIRVRDQTHLWANAYEGELPGLIGLEDRLAREVAGEIAGKLGLAEPVSAASRNPHAQEAYLRGRYHLHQLTREDTEKAIGYFQQATAADPKDAGSYASLAAAYLDLTSFYRAPNQTMPRVRQAALKAIELDPELAEAHAALGTEDLLYEWNWPEAESELHRALELNPNSAEAHVAYASYLITASRFPEGLRESRLAFQLDPVSHFGHGNSLWHFLVARQYDESIVQCRKMLELQPNYFWAHSILALALFYKSKPDIAIDEAQRGSQLGNNPIADAVLAFVYAGSGHRLDAQHIVDGLAATQDTRYVCGFNLATVYAALGEKDKAFESLERAYRQRSD
jgi:TolB-like protein/DNA-binding winged helix-turn-helix (wHTH) protein/Tfp pilus assembly protein PilF